VRRRNRILSAIFLIFEENKDTESPIIKTPVRAPSGEGRANPKMVRTRRHPL